MIEKTISNIRKELSKFAVLSCLKHKLPLRFQHLTDPSGQRELS